MVNKILKYRTRDANGNEVVKDVQIKGYPETKAVFVCPCCGKTYESGVETKKIVSSNFTDWQYVGDLVCPSCADLFSLYFYSYLVDQNGIHLLNVRELREQLEKTHGYPFLFCITVSKKKHLFYKARWNYGGEQFAVNLEEETIHTTTKRMKQLFDFVECLLTLGCSKSRLQDGEINYQALKKVGYKAQKFLLDELKKSREIQIPLYCGQKREIIEEEAICCINSTLMI